MNSDYTQRDGVVAIETLFNAVHAFNSTWIGRLVQALDLYPEHVDFPVDVHIFEHINPTPNANISKFLAIACENDHLDRCTVWFGPTFTDVVDDIQNNICKLDVTYKFLTRSSALATALAAR